MHPTLHRYELRVYGSNGCRGWVLRAGLPSTVEPGAQAGLGLSS
jgi:hypothetical protein